MDPSVPGGGAADAIVAARDYAIADAELLVRDRDAVADNDTLGHITDIDRVIGAVPKPRPGIESARNTRHPNPSARQPKRSRS
jgi:hypothetical protein